MKSHWGSLGSSIFSLFMAITGGDDWRNFVDVFESDSTYLLNYILFSMYIAFATMVMLNLVTGVFVEGAQKIFKEEKEGNLVKLTAKMFAEADKDHSEEISHDEFCLLVQERCMDDWFGALGFSLAEADTLFRVLDDDGSGSLSLAEFARGCLQMRNPVKACDLAMVQYNLRIMNEELTEQMLHVYTLITGEITKMRESARLDKSEFFPGLSAPSLDGSFPDPTLGTPWETAMEEELV